VLLLLLLFLLLLLPLPMMPMLRNDHFTLTALPPPPLLLLLVFPAHQFTGAPNSEVEMAQKFARLRGLGCAFAVAGRLSGGSFLGFEDIQVGKGLKSRPFDDATERQILRSPEGTVY
jgi:hypothetical protein